MDGNKDAALKCLRVGQAALQSGDKPRAYRFLSKARRLDPSLPVAAELLSSLLKEISQQEAEVSELPEEGHKASEDRTGEREARGFDAGMNGCNGQHGSKADPDYSREQVEIVQRIQRTKEYYQILGLNKECSAEEVRKAYRKVSLKVHPDKNKAPGSEEAFKAVSKAFACLNDDELRKRYDQFGPEEAQEVAHQHYPRRRRTNGYYYQADMFDAEEIFNSFFFGSSYANPGFQRAHFVRTRGTAERSSGTGAQTQEVRFGGLLGLLQLLPILALFLFSIFPFSQPIYSLDQVSPYQFRYVTGAHEVPFFVKSLDFDKSYPVGTTSRRNVEAQVERDYREILGHHCRNELQRRYWYPSVETPHCDLLRKFQVY